MGSDSSNQVPPGTRVSQAAVSVVSDTPSEKSVEKLDKEFGDPAPKEPLLKDVVEAQDSGDKEPFVQKVKKQPPRYPRKISDEFDAHGRKLCEAKGCKALKLKRGLCETHLQSYPAGTSSASRDLRQDMNYVKDLPEQDQQWGYKFRLEFYNGSFKDEPLHRSHAQRKELRKESSRRRQSIEISCLKIEVLDDVTRVDFPDEIDKLQTPIHRADRKMNNLAWALDSKREIEAVLSKDPSQEEILQAIEKQLKKLRKSYYS